MQTLTKRREKAVIEINQSIELGTKGDALNEHIKSICNENQVKVKNIKTILHL